MIYTQKTVRLIIFLLNKRKTNLAIGSFKFGINSIACGPTNRTNNCSIFSNQSIKYTTFTNIWTPYDCD